MFAFLQIHWFIYVILYIRQSKNIKGTLYNTKAVDHQIYQSVRLQSISDCESVLLVLVHRKHNVCESDFRVWSIMIILPIYMSSLRQTWYAFSTRQTPTTPDMFFNWMWDTDIVAFTVSNEFTSCIQVNKCCIEKKCGTLGLLITSMALWN